MMVCDYHIKIKIDFAFLLFYVTSSAFPSNVIL